MATRQHGQIVETPTEARQGERGPSVLALLSASTGLAVLILGVVWFVFFRTCGWGRRRWRLLPGATILNCRQTRFGSTAFSGEVDTGSR